MNKWNMHNSASILENETHKFLWDFEIQTEQQTSRPSNLQQQQQQQQNKACTTVDFAVLADNLVKLKEGEKKDKYLDLGRKLKKPWNIKVTIISIVIGALGTVTEVLVNGLEDLEITGLVDIIKTTALLRSAIILRRVLEI